MYCIAYHKYRKSKKTKISYILKRTSSLSIVYSKGCHEYEKIYIRKNSGLIDNIEAYQKIYDHV